MNNLKRVLSLGLAGTMLTGMMMVGASAANKEFTDADEITHVEAVNSMAALGVIAGKDTGAFDPDGTVTRAEMAKIICVMLSGGEDPTLGTKTVPTYSDIKGHWAESYIEYCSSIGIIAGQGDGTFGPDATVTGSAAAKMFMVALGYDSDVFGFTGIDWSINVNREASNAKLYDEIKGVDVSAGLSRDNAAQMAYNALDAKVMNKTYDKVQSNGEISYNYELSTTESFLNKYFDAHTFIGTYTGNYDSGASSNKGEVAVYGKLDNATAESPKTVATFPSDMDITNIGEEVKIIFKDGKGGSANKPDKKDTIYGVFNTGTTTVYEVTKADIQDAESTTKIKFGGVKYDIDTANGVEVVVNYITDAPTTYTNAATLQSSVLKFQSVDTIKFVTNEDGKINAAYITEYYAGKVSGVTSSKVTISGVGAIEIEDNDIYEGIAKDDVVAYTRFYDTNKDDAFFTVTKTESVEGELTGYKQDGGLYVNVVVDGTTYKIEGKPAAIANLTDDAITAPASGNIGDTVRVFLVNGMAVAVQSIDQTGGKYAMITERSATGTLGSTMDPIKVSVLLPDGTEQTLNLHKDSLKSPGNAVTLGDVPAGTLVEYSSISNGTIKLKSVAGQVANSGAATPITATDAAGTPGNARVWDKTAKTLTYSAKLTAVASSDAALFILVDKNANGTWDAGEDFFAYNMRGVGNINNTATNGVKVAYYLKDGQAVAAYMVLTAKPGSSTADTLYGIVTGYNGTRTLNDDTYYQYTVAVGRDEDVVVNVDDASTLAAGDLVMFDEATDTKYTGNDGVKNSTGDITHLVTATGVAQAKSDIVAVKDYNESNRLLTYYTDLARPSVTGEFTGTMASITVDKDVKIVYVNAKDNEAGEEVGVGAFDASTGYANAVFHTDDDGIVDAILVETSGKANLDKYGSGKNAATTNFGSTTSYAMTGAAKATIKGAEVTVTANDATVLAGNSTSFTVTVATPAAGAAGIEAGTITVALANLGSATVNTTTGTNCSASLAGTTLTITIDTAATATSGTFVVSGTPTASVTASAS
ncbi:S-layer homology domain-containing protein [Pseudoflavonifractor phocaeensis]|uniref:S-layer homology domain-containing protein n=1 Tax=Pseudoflavonifractor phocaeensis TaxID=1870988 RepID=UPI00313E16E5